MDKFYRNADTKLVGTTVVYPDSSEILYEDAAHTKKVSKEALVDAFMSGTLCILTSAKLYERAIALTVETAYAKVDTESTAFYSDGYTAS